MTLSLHYKWPCSNDKILLSKPVKWNIWLRWLNDSRMKQIDNKNTWKKFSTDGSCGTTSSPQKTLGMRQQSHSNTTRGRVQSTTIIQKEIFTSPSMFHPGSTIITFQICFILFRFVTNWWLSNYLKIPSRWGIYPSLHTTSRSRILHFDHYSQEGTTRHYPSRTIHAKNNDRLDW